mgnify:CR=1 FL=1
MKAISYYRYSSSNKRQMDNSEARQADKCRALIVKKGWIPVEEVADYSISGGKRKQNLMGLKERIESGEVECDVIVIDNLNRITRRDVLDMTEDIGWMRHEDVALSMQDYDGGKPMTISEIARDSRLMNAGIQNHEKLHETAEKVSDGMLVKFKRGRLGWMGKAPYGYQIKKWVDEPSSLIPDEDFKVIQEMIRYFIKENNLRGCVRYLNKTKRFKDNPDKVPSSSSAKNILRNSIYCGVRTIGVRGVGDYATIRANKTRYINDSPLSMAVDTIEYTPEGFKPAITLEEFKVVQEILNERQKGFRKRPDRRRHKYSGLMRCGNCGTPLIAATYKPKKGESEELGKKIRYVCPQSSNTTTQKCLSEERPHTKGIREDEFDYLLGKSFHDFFLNEDTHRANIVRLVDELEKRSKKSSKKVETDLDIQRDRLIKIQEVYFEVGGDEMHQQYKDQAVLVRELEEKEKSRKEKETTPQTVLDLAKEIWEESRGKEGKDRYLGYCYKYAAEVVKEKNKKKRDILLKKSAKDLLSGILLSYRFEVGRENLNAMRNSIVHGVEEYDQQKMTEWIKKARRKSAGKFANSMIGKADEMLELLGEMGLDHIVVRFERDLWRGRWRNEPKAFDFVMSVTGYDHTSTGVALISYQTLSLH